MTKELLQEQLEILDRTNMHKNAAKERVIPESYLAYKNQVEQKETMLESPSTGVPVRCVITKANNLEKDAPLFINLHGGGFVHPQDGDDDLFCARVAAEIGGIVVDVDYAVTPEYVFPTAFEQVCGRMGFCTCKRAWRRLEPDFHRRSQRWRCADCSHLLACSKNRKHEICASDPGLCGTG